MYCVVERTGKTIIGVQQFLVVIVIINFHVMVSSAVVEAKPLDKIGDYAFLVYSIYLVLVVAGS